MSDMERIMGTLEGELSAPATLDAALTLEHIVAPIPEGYIKPEGTIAITENGTVDVTEYAEAAVDVPIPEIVPLEVTANGTYTAPEGTAYSPITVDVQEVEPQPPTDGKTHIWIEIDENTPANRLKFTLRWTQTVSRGVQVDWGDGSDPQTYTGTSAADHDHTYPGAGEYEITLEVLSGQLKFVGSNSSGGYAIYGSKAYSNAYNRGRIYQMAIGDGVTQVGPYTFSNCYNLQSITIPNGIAIDNELFNGSYKLRTIKIPDGVSRIGTYMFNNCYGLLSVEIPDSVTSIGSYAFNYCHGLTSVKMSSNLESVDSNALSYCSNLKRITMPEGMKTIGAYAFQYCYSLMEVTIPSTVTSIGRLAFSNCSSIGRIRFEATTPPTVPYASTFGVGQDCIISVPVGTLEAYTTAANYPSASTYTYVEE